MKFARYVRMLCAVTAIWGAVVLHSLDKHPVVYAQIYNQPDIYSLKARIDVDSSLIDQMKEKQGQIDRHLEAQDIRLNDLNDKTAHIQGVGAGLLGTVGVLEIVGLIATSKAAKGIKTE